MRQRDFLGVLGGAAAMRQLSGRVQQVVGKVVAVTGKQQ
jgi:hypothetical protein